MICFPVWILKSSNSLKTRGESGLWMHLFLLSSSIIIRRSWDPESVDEDPFRDELFCESALSLTLLRSSTPPTPPPMIWFWQPLCDGVGWTSIWVVKIWEGFFLLWVFFWFWFSSTFWWKSGTHEFFYALWYRRSLGLVLRSWAY